VIRALKRWLAAGALVAGMLLGAAPAGAQHVERGELHGIWPLPTPHPYYQYPQPAACWVDVRVFRSIRYGAVPYCRERMRYRPGAYECRQIIDHVCAVVMPGSAQLIDARTPLERRLIVCPEGPPPPMCRRMDLQ